MYLKPTCSFGTLHWGESKAYLWISLFVERVCLEKESKHSSERLCASLIYLPSCEMTVCCWRTLTLSLTLSLVFCSYTPHLLYRVYRKILASSSFCFFLSLLLPKQLCGTQQKPNTWYSWQPRLSTKSRFEQLSGSGSKVWQSPNLP